MLSYRLFIAEIVMLLHQAVEQRLLGGAPRAAGSSSLAGAVDFHWIRILFPPQDSNSIPYSSGVVQPGAMSSTKAGLVALFRRRVGTPPSCFFSLV
jgi:hypothetical protein